MLSAVRYWAFIQNYPDHCVVDGLSWIKAFDALTWSYTDRLLFGQSNATFSKNDSKELLDVLTSLRRLRRVALKEPSWQLINKLPEWMALNTSLSVLEITVSNPAGAFL